LTAVVTGGGGALGSAIARAVAREGAAVVVNDLGTASSGEGADPSRAVALAEDICAAGGTAYADTGDVTDDQDAERLIRQAVERLGKVDILINAVGILRLGTAVDTERADFDEVLRVNLTGVFNTTRFAAQHWVARGDYGRLINFASGASITSQPALLAYSTSKTGIIGFTRSCANAFASYNVTANCIRPSAASPMMDATSPEAWKLYEKTGKLQSQTAMGTPLDPDHVTPLVVFLASKKAAHVSGRLFEGRGGHYALWTEPEEERSIDRDFLQDPEGVYAELERMTEDLSLRDLKMPLPPLDSLGDWKRTYGTRTPLWDFVERPRPSS
jgi:NAD(P)-dependent dehydrogenase (short-subunit alcohol dehydrogenase family)